MVQHSADCPASLGPMSCCCGAERPSSVRSESLAFEDAGTSLSDEDRAFLDRSRVVMKKCQVGTKNLDAAHDILADCYGTIGRLITLVERREQPKNDMPAILDRALTPSG